jgi:hypothetical protein
MKKVQFFILFFLVSCTNPFSTREPEQPVLTSTPQAVNSLQNHPDSLFTKIKYAFKEKNVNYYLDCLIDPTRWHINYTFIPHQHEMSRLISWNRQDEYNYFYGIINDENTISFDLQIFSIQDWTLIGASQDTMQSRFSYEIALNLKNKKEYYRGRSIFKIFRSPQSLWYIYYWEDLQLEANQTEGTWSTLKASYRYQ